MEGFWGAVASAGPYANNLHLAPDNHTSTPPQFFTGRMLFLTPNQQCQSTEGIYLPFLSFVNCHMALSSSNPRTLNNL